MASTLTPHTARHPRRTHSGAAGHLSQIEIDTAHFKGNFPESCEVHALRSAADVPDEQWTRVLPRTKLGPHRQHHFQLENVAGAAYTHVRVTIHPDGGIKRVRVVGRRALEGADADQIQDSDAAAAAANPDTNAPSASSNPAPAPRPGPVTVLPALPLTPEAFAPFGQVLQAYADIHAVPSPRTTRVTPANQGSALKFHKLALLHSSYPPSAGATAGLSVYRCTPTGARAVRVLERHPCTNQAFVPMGAEPGSRYLVVVARIGEDGRPEVGSLRAFVAEAAQGVVYDTGVWRESLPSLRVCRSGC